MKTSVQLLAQNFRLAAFDARRRFQIAFGVKREWKKGNDGGEDYSGNPETAHMHGTHDVIQDRGRLRDIRFLHRYRRTSGAKKVPGA
jgi:hypothetical protein